jgi:hypothetical protein
VTVPGAASGVNPIFDVGAVALVSLRRGDGARVEQDTLLLFAGTPMTVPDVDARMLTVDSDWAIASAWEAGYSPGDSGARVGTSIALLGELNSRRANLTFVLGAANASATRQGGVAVVSLFAPKWRFVEASVPLTPYGLVQPPVFVTSADEPNLADVSPPLVAQVGTPAVGFGTSQAALDLDADGAAELLLGSRAAGRIVAFSMEDLNGINQDIPALASQILSWAVVDFVSISADLSTGVGNGFADTLAVVGDVDGNGAWSAGATGDCRVRALSRAFPS